MFEDLATPEDIESLCSRGLTESLNLEFKLKEDAASPVPSKGDKRAIAEAISSFANSDGGTLVLGVATLSQSGADVAHRTVPIADVSTFKSAVDLICHTNISPQIPNLRSKAVILPGGSGYVVCEVPRSDRRPHMSTAPGVHSYYRRDFHGSGLMTPSEIRDQMLAVRYALLKSVVRIGGGGNFTNHGNHMSAALPLTFSLRNEGQALCKNPFMRVRTRLKLISHLEPYDPAVDAFKTDFSYGTLIHIEDELRCVGLRFSAMIDFLELSRLFEEREENLTSAVTLLPYMDPVNMITFGDKTSLDDLRLEISFGAENAVLTTEKVTVSRADVARKVLTESTVRDMFLSAYSPWCTDVVQRFAASAGIETLKPKSIDQVVAK